MDFVGRESQIAYMKDFLSSNNSLANIYGPVGVGKHTFINEIIENHTANQNKVRIIASDNESLISFLIRLKNILKREFSLKFPLFELCESKYRIRNGEVYITSKSNNDIFEAVKSLFYKVTKVSAVPESIYKLLIATYTEFNKHRTKKKNLDLIKTILNSKDEELSKTLLEAIFGDLVGKGNKTKPYLIFVENIQNLNSDYNSNYGTGKDKELFLKHTHKYSGFKFIVSSVLALQYIHDKTMILKMPYFSPEEISSYFSDFNLDYNDVIQIHHETHGDPTQLMVIKELFINNPSNKIDLKDYDLCNNYSDFFSKTFSNEEKDVLDLLSCFGTWSKEYADEMINDLAPYISPNSLQKIYDSFLIDERDKIYSIKPPFRKFLYSNCNEKIKLSVSGFVKKRLNRMKEHFFEIIKLTDGYNNTVSLLMDQIYILRETVKYSVCIDSDFLKENMLLSDLFGANCEIYPSLRGLALEYYKCAYDCAISLYHINRDYNTYWNLRNCTKALSNYYFRLHNITQAFYYKELQVNYEYWHVDLNPDSGKFYAYLSLSESIDNYLNQLVIKHESYEDALEHYDRILEYYVRYSQKLLTRYTNSDVLCVFIEALAKFSLSFKDNNLKVDEVKSHLHSIYVQKSIFNEIQNLNESLDRYTKNAIDAFSFYHQCRLYILREYIDELDHVEKIQFQDLSLKNVSSIKERLDDIERYLRKERSITIVNDQNYLMKVLSSYYN